MHINNIIINKPTVILNRDGEVVVMAVSDNCSWRLDLGGNFSNKPTIINWDDEGSTRLILEK